MISIRYRNELSPGLHAAAEQHGRTTTVYLLSGLTVAQRRAALRRLRISARRGYGPGLPGPQLALALAADRIRTTIARAGAVFRSHPAGSTVPVMVLSAGAIAFLALSAVSIQVIHQPLNPGPPSFSGASGPIASASARSKDARGPAAGPGGPAGQAGPAGQDGPGAQAGQPGAAPGQPGSGSAPGDGQPGGGAEPSASGGNSPGATSPAAGATEPGSGQGTTLASGAAPTPSPGGDPATAPPSSAAPSAKPAPTPTASKTKTCLKLGPLGVCL